jgi:hypothetical protein
MLESITPLGERGRGSRWGVTVGFFVAGSLAAGALLGAGLGVIGQASAGAIGSPDRRLLMVAGLAVVGFLWDGRVLPFGFPAIHRQVNEQWLFHYRGWYYGLGFGFQLGLGVATIVTTSAVYLSLVAALLSGSVAGGLVVGSAFGLARAATVLGAARVDSPGRLAEVGRWLERWDGPSRRATAWSLLAVAVLAATVVVA